MRCRCLDVSNVTERDNPNPNVNLLLDNNIPLSVSSYTKPSATVF